MKITYNGQRPSTPKFNIHWAGGETKGHFQPWHCNQFVDAAQMGIELIYPYEDCTVSAELCPEPFKRLSDKFYQLELNVTLATPANFSLLVIPHYRYFTTDNMPLPLLSSWQTDWWPKPLTVIFRYGQNPSIFKSQEPFAQAISIERTETEISEMASFELDRRKQIDENSYKYITRKWTTVDGTDLDNLYNVMCHMNRKGKFETKQKKKFRLIGKINDKMVPDKKKEE